MCVWRAALLGVSVTVGAALAAAALSVIAPARAEAISDEDRTFATYLIRELGYLDAAENWVQAYRKRRNLRSEDKADLDSLYIDILKGQGREEEALKKLEAFKREYPTHPRASMGEVEVVGLALVDVLKILGEAAVLLKEEREPKIATALKKFENEVLKPVDAQIVSLEKKYKAAKDAYEKNRKPKDPPEDEATVAALRTLTQTELSRLNFRVSFARKLPRDHALRKVELEKVRKLAENFVGDRFDFPIMQYNGQLQLGICCYELGSYDAAYDNLSLLIDIEPPLQPTPPLIQAVRALRIQSLLFSARANNALARFDKAVSDIETHFLTPSKSAFDISTAASEPDFRIVATLLRLEYGVALAGSGQTSRGLEEIQRIIDDKGAPAGLITDARNALGRVATVAGVKLRGRDYYQAAIGLKSEHQWDDALNAFQVALGNLNPSTAGEMKEFAPLCLNEIGEINFLQGRFIESALAYEEACERFASTDNPITAKVSKNFLAAITRAIKTTAGGTEHKALERLKSSATAFSNKFAGEDQQNEILMFDARNLEKDGNYGAARAKYLEIAAEAKGQRVKQYWGAQAGAWACVFRQWEQQTDLAAKQNLAGELEKGIAALQKIYPAALSEKNLEAAAKAVLTLGQIYYSREDWTKAAESMQLFGGELAGDDVFGSTGLGTLIICESRAGLVDKATEHFATLIAKYKDEPVVSIAAIEVADGWRNKGDLAKAAEYVLAYANHPASKGEMEQPSYMAQVAQRLIDGGKISESAAIIEKIKELAGNDKKKKNEELERQVIFLEAKVHAYQKKWDEAIAKLTSYAKSYKLRGENYEDPYVCRDLMTAYLNRTAPEPTLEDLKFADQWGNSACALMMDRAKIDSTLQATYWQWFLAFLEARMRLAAKGDVNKYLDVIRLVDDALISMGESALPAAEVDRISNELAEFKRRAQASTAKPAGK